MRPARLTQLILIAAALGIVTGLLYSRFFPQLTVGFANTIELLPTIFLRLIKTIIGPLVFSSIVVSVARLGDPRVMGRVGIRAFGWFLFASVLSLSIGLLLANFLEPGNTRHLLLPGSQHPTKLGGSVLSARDLITQAVPTSIADALARNDVLQIVLTSVLLGVAAAALGQRSTALVDVCDSVTHVMLKVTGYVMSLAPLAVFGALGAATAQSRPGVIFTYAVFIAEFYLGLFTLWITLAALGRALIGRELLVLLRSIRDPALVAFATASSEAAYPKTLEQLERLGYRKEIISFVLAIGYSFNNDGSMMYCAFASLFVAQLFGIQLSGVQQIALLGTLLLTSKGMAGVPRASLLVLAATLPQFQIPENGILLLLGVDQFLDMGRSATNVMGNSIAVALVSRWEERQTI